MQSRATAVITDSGGIQEETTYMGVPCLTLRKNTEDRLRVSAGTNVLIGHDYANSWRNCTRFWKAVQNVELSRPCGMVTPVSALRKFFVITFTLNDNRHVLFLMTASAIHVTRETRGKVVLVVARVHYAACLACAGIFGQCSICA